MCGPGRLAIHEAAKWVAKRELQKGNQKGCRDIFRHLLPIEFKGGCLLAVSASLFTVI